MLIEIAAAAADRSQHPAAASRGAWQLSAPVAVIMPALEPGSGGLPKAMLRSADGAATAEVYQHGATLTSWAVGGRELLFLSPKAAFEAPKAIRGGVPVCFPQFAMLGPLASQHGFARNREWQVADLTDSSVTLVLSSSEDTLALWPHPFQLEMTVRVLAGGQGGVAHDLDSQLHVWAQL